METPNDDRLTRKARDTLARALNHILADEGSLSALTRDYRWRITRPHLYSLHRLFDEQRRQLDFWVDQVCARLRATGLAVIGDWRAPPDRASSGAPRTEPRSLIGDLLARHEAMARALRRDLAELVDPVTAQLLTRLIEFHETSAWMLRMLHDGPEVARP